jgi:hypothetical protein
MLFYKKSNSVKAVTIKNLKAVLLHIAQHSFIFFYLNALLLLAKFLECTESYKGHNTKMNNRFA